MRHGDAPLAAGAGLRPADRRGERGGCIAEFIVASWERFGRPCSKRAVVSPRGCVERYVAARVVARAVLVHGDIHEWNTLQADDGYKLVDPDGLLAEAEYDLGVIIREEPVLSS